MSGDKKPITFYARRDIYDWLMQIPAGLRSHVINARLQMFVSRNSVDSVVRAIIEAPNAEPEPCEQD